MALSAFDNSCSTEVSLQVERSLNAIVNLIGVSLRLANKLSLVAYWKFNIFLLEIQDFRDWLESLIQRELVGW